MPRYWVIAPSEANPSDVFDKIWQFDLVNNIITIGWSELGDVSKMSREELSEAIASTYYAKPATARGLYTNMIWDFYHEIKPGDFVIARKGRKVLAAVGKVSETAIYAPGRNPATRHPNVLGVLWGEQPRDKVFHTVVFPMQTVKDLTEEQFRSFAEVSTVSLPKEADVPADVADEMEFVLEKYLEEFIVSNFPTIFKGELKIYQDSDGNDGQQYSTEIGPIDILAVEPKTGAFVVIELKKGRPSDHVVGQILRYMGWVKKNLCKDGQMVKGLVISSDSDPKLTYALAAVSNIELRRYKASFELIRAPLE